MSRDAVILFISRVTSAASTLLVLAVAARLRSPEELGLIATGLTLGLALAILPEAGMTALYIREVVRDPSRTAAFLAAMVAIRVVTLPLAIIGAGIIAVAIAGAGASIVLLVAIGPAIQQVGELSRATFLAHHRIALASAHTIVENVLWAGVIIVGLVAGEELSPTFAAADVVLVLVALLGFVLVRMVVGVRLVLPGRPEVDRLVRQAGPFAVFSALAVVVLRVDAVFIGLLMADGVVAVGLYYAASRVAAMGDYVSESVGRSIYPELARTYPDDPPGVGRLLSAALGRIMPLGILMAVGLTLFGSDILVLFYGPDFLQQAGLLAALGLLIPIRFAASLSGVALTSVDAQSLRTIVLGVAVAVSIPVYILLVPVIGVFGAVAGVYAAWIPMAIIHLVAIQRRVGPVIAWKALGRWIAVGVVLYVVGRLIADSSLPEATVIAIVAFGILSLVALWVLRGTWPTPVPRSPPEPIVSQALR